MAKFKSMKELLFDTKETARRFPWTLICACLGALAMVMYVEYPFDIQKELWRHVHLAMIAGLGLTGFTSIRLYSETHNWSAAHERNFNLAYLFVLAAYFMILPKEMRYLDLNRYGLINANLHLLVAIAPFLLLKDCTNAFWQYNKHLFIRFALAFIYSNTIFIGIAIAMGVADHLFAFIKFDGETYAQLWFLVVGIFNTWFFLKGIPDGILGLQGRDDYPRGLRIFTQFVLIPLVVLYLFILYMYMGKIIATWSLPRGFLSCFVLGVSIMGIVTLLLVHPLRESESHGWIRFYSKYFYLALFPLIILMVIAISVRINEYGITEQRYFVLVFSLWLLLLAVRFSLKPQTDIRTIPFTLFVLVAIATWGPWSAMSVSRWDQTRRLKEALVNNGLMKDGRVVKSPTALDYKVSGEISNIAAYLEQSFGLSALESWAPAGGEKVSWDKLSANDFVTKYLGLEYTGYYHGRLFEQPYDTYPTYFNFATKQDALKRVKGYDYFAQFYLYSVGNTRQNSTQIFTTDKGNVTLSFDSASGEVRCEYAGRTYLFTAISQERLNEFMRLYGNNKYDIAPHELSFSIDEPAFAGQVTIMNLSGQIPREETPSPALANVTGEIMFSLP